MDIEYIEWCYSNTMGLVGFSQDQIYKSQKDFLSEMSDIDCEKSRNFVENVLTKKILSNLGILQYIGNDIEELLEGFSVVKEKSSEIEIRKYVMSKNGLYTELLKHIDTNLRSAFDSVAQYQKTNQIALSHLLASMNFFEKSVDGVWNGLRGAWDEVTIKYAPRRQTPIFVG